jgi:hypothetical protein
MSDKSVWLVTLVVGNEDLIQDISTEAFTTKSQAHIALTRWKDNLHPENTLEYVSKSDGNVSGTNLQGKMYRGQIERLRIDPDDYSEYVNKYAVQLKLTKTYIVTAHVSAEDEMSAEDLAIGNSHNGDYNDDIDWDYPEDEEVELYDIEPDDSY